MDIEDDLPRKPCGCRVTALVHTCGPNLNHRTFDYVLIDTRRLRAYRGVSGDEWEAILMPGALLRWARDELTRTEALRRQERPLRVIILETDGRTRTGFVMSPDPKEQQHEDVQPVVETDDREPHEE